MDFTKDRWATRCFITCVTTVRRNLSFMKHIYILCFRETLADSEQLLYFGMVSVCLPIEDFFTFEVFFRNKILKFVIISTNLKNILLLRKKKKFKYFILRDIVTGSRVYVPRILTRK